MATLIRRYYKSVDKVTGKNIRRMSPKWYGQYLDAHGKTQRTPLSTNKVAAQQMLTAIVRKVEMARAGIFDPFEEHAKRPLLEHLTDWESVLRARRNTEEYVVLKVSRARKIIEACKFKRIADLSASRVESCLADFRESADNCGTQTSNHYLGAIKQFARWLVKDRRTADNVLSHLAGGNVKLDRRHERRELSDADLITLFAATRGGKIFRRLSGPDREMLYLTAVYTGLRASELASLTPQSFAIDIETPTVTVEAGYSKHRREDTVPLHDELVRRLRHWLAGKAAGERVWPGKWASSKKAHQMLKHDLEQAGIPYRDVDGLCADFHSLRYVFVTRLVKAGVRPKEAQALARHSTITLTMDRYARVGLSDTSAAMGQVPTIGPGTGTEPNTMRATGTDGFTCTKLALDFDERRGTVRKPAEMGQDKNNAVRSPQVLGMTTHEDARGTMMSGGGEIRTREHLTASPVFKTGDSPDASTDNEKTSGFQEKTLAPALALTDADNLRLHIATHTQGDIE